MNPPYAEECLPILDLALLQKIDTTTTNRFVIQFLRFGDPAKIRGLHRYRLRLGKHVRYFTDESLSDLLEEWKLTLSVQNLTEALTIWNQDEGHHEKTEEELQRLKGFATLKECNAGQ
jgi:hypothetical protein